MPASEEDQGERTAGSAKAIGIAGWVGSILPFMAVSLVPLALLLFVHHRLAVDVPYGGDDWWFLDTLYFPWSEGHGSVSDLFALHHEHRHGIPFMLMLGVAYLSGCSVAAQQLAFVGCLLAILAILWREAGPIVGSRRYLVLLPLAFLALGPRQWEQIGWVGFGLTFAVPLLLSVSVFTALASVSRSATERHRHMCVASAAALRDRCVVVGSIRLARMARWSPADHVGRAATVGAVALAPRLAPPGASHDDPLPARMETGRSLTPRNGFIRSPGLVRHLPREQPNRGVVRRSRHWCDPPHPVRCSRRGLHPRTVD